MRNSFSLTFAMTCKFKSLILKTTRDKETIQNDLTSWCSTKRHSCVADFSVTCLKESTCYFFPRICFVVRIKAIQGIKTLFYNTGIFTVYKQVFWYLNFANNRRKESFVLTGYEPMVGTSMTIGDVMVSIMISGRHFKLSYPFFVFANYENAFILRLRSSRLFISYHI